MMLHLLKRNLPATRGQAAQILVNLGSLKEFFMSKADELAAKLDAIGAAVDKIGTETTALVAEVTDLKAQLESAGVPQELIDKADAVLTRAQAVDALVPDAAPAPVDSGSTEVQPATADLSTKTE